MDEEDVHEGVELCCDVDVLSGVRRHGGGSIARDMDAQRHRGERETQLCAGILVLWNQIAQPGTAWKKNCRRLSSSHSGCCCCAEGVGAAESALSRARRTHTAHERPARTARRAGVGTLGLDEKRTGVADSFSARGSCVGPRARSPPRSGLALESCADWLRGGLDRVRPTRPRASVSSLADARARFSDRHGRSTDSSEDDAEAEPDVPLRERMERLQDELLDARELLERVAPGAPRVHAPVTVTEAFEMMDAAQAAKAKENVRPSTPARHLEARRAAVPRARRSEPASPRSNNRRPGRRSFLHSPFRRLNRRVASAPDREAHPAPPYPPPAEIQKGQSGRREDEGEGHARLVAIRRIRSSGNCTRRISRASSPRTRGTTTPTFARPHPVDHTRNRSRMDFPSRNFRNPPRRPR